MAFLAVAMAAAVGGQARAAADPAALRLVPFPKEVVRQPGAFPLAGRLVLEAPGEQAALVGGHIGEELRRAGLPPAEVHPIAAAGFWRLGATPGGAAPKFRFRDGATPEDYVLEVRGDAVVCGAPGPAGLFYGAQTLCQLIRANRTAAGLGCLTIRDWPSLRWRCFQDDLTRGPSARLEALEREVAMGAGLKMNLFTYYMEYQFAFRKHPVIGPKDGSLTPDELRALVEAAKPLHVDILGNQQSFGHFSRILAHPEYAHLRETGYLLCPVKEETYRLLDDLYSEVVPLLPFPWFNVCCDETEGIGEGPSKELASKIGVGGVYVRHVGRLHDLLRDKYKKRMMMWGDIILRHPDRLSAVPRDTIMLTWGYDARANFEDQIVPFAKAGYEFLVCPGVSNWSRILPDFGVATTNIRHFVRDGAKHGAMGMLNTAWEDDGEALGPPKWHGYAWGAECAWNASATSPQDFNRRVGAVLFGETGDHFGQAIEALARTHRLAGMRGMNNARFWQDDTPAALGAPGARASATRLLEIVGPAIDHLEACRRDATVNADLLDFFLQGARRMELIGRRMLDVGEVAALYRQACDAAPGEAVPLLGKAEALVARTRDAHAALGREFARLWLAESKPYALDWTMSRYAAAVERYDGLAKRLASARATAAGGRPIPAPEELGLAGPEGYARRTRPQRTLAEPLTPDTPWFAPEATHRVALAVEAGEAERFDLPVEIDLRLPDGLVGRPVRALVRRGEAAEQEVPVQIAPSPEAGKARLTCVVPGALPKGGAATLWVYFGLPAPPVPLPGTVSTSDGPENAKWIENDKVRLLLGPEGGHVYRWLVKEAADRDLTMPGETGWAGFADMGYPWRGAAHELTCVARGPALVRYRCREPETGLEKTIGLWAGAAWMEVTLSQPATYYWDFDDPRNFAADGSSPGKYLFSDGRSGAVGREADGVPAQVEAAGVFWGVKFDAAGLALGLVTPETAARHHVAPGAGAGGVGIEGSRPAGHFVTFGGRLPDTPARVMDRLRGTLDFRNPPRIVLHGLQAR